MTKAEQIRTGFQRIAETVGPRQTLLAKVFSVDEAELTCVIDEDGMLIHDVRLRPVINGNESITIFPVVDSWVMVARIENDEEWMVIAVDQADKIKIVTGEMIFEMKGGKFLIQSGGDNLGKCMDDLITQIQAIYAPKNSAAIAAIKQRFKQLLSGT